MNIVNTASSVECRSRVARVAGPLRIRAASAFSLLEIMVVIGLLSVIILGLMAMFTQTQRAFRLGMTQTDVLEGGRMATALIVRELEQATPTYLDGRSFGSTNFFMTTNRTAVPLLPWALPGGSFPRLNALDDLFFITHENQVWTGIGYFVRQNLTNTATATPVGTLYRFETNNPTPINFRSNPGGLIFGFNQARGGLPGNGISKILDGVVHFRIRAYDADGNLIAPPSDWVGQAYFQRLSAGYNTNIAAYPSSIATNDVVSFYAFRSNAVPASVEFELGVLEPAAYEQYKSIPIYDAQIRFLTNQATRVHLFRQRVAIRRVDTAAYR
jgi:hypothetical protein